VVSVAPSESGGTETLADAKRFPGVTVLRTGVDFEGTEGAKMLAAELRESNCSGHKTIAVESATSAQEVMLRELMGWTEETAPGQVGFGDVDADTYRDRADKMKKLLSLFVNLPAHVIVSAKEKDHNPKKSEKVNPKTGKTQPDMRPKFVRETWEKTFLGPDVGGGAAGWLMDCCDYVCRLTIEHETKAQKVSVNGVEEVVQVETGKFERQLRIMWHPNIAGGFRSRHKLSIEFIPDPTWEKINKVIQTGKL
jgi:hypothetical protein